VAKFDMTPDPSLLEDIGAGSFTVAEAIAELVANCFDARVDDKPVTVDVRIDDSEIWVIDDGKGMTEDEFPSRMRLAFKDQERMNSGKAVKGMYGLGLKTACASLGRSWGVYTRAQGETKTHNFELDLEEWSKRSGAANPSWEHEITSAKSFDSSPIDSQESGTAVYIRKLRSKVTIFSAVQDKLSKAYKPHLAAGDTITVNGVALSPDEIDIRAESRVEIEASIGPNGEYPIHGWLGVGDTSNDQNFGVNIYRQGQLVEAWNKDWFRAHLMTSRVRGDVHLDFVPSNFHKKGLDKQSIEWQIASEYMKEAIAPIKVLSQNLSKNKSDPTRDERAFKGFDQNLSTVSGVERAAGIGSGGSSTGQKGGSVTVDQNSGSNTPAAEIRDGKLIVGKEEISIIRKVQEMPTVEKHWDFAYEANKGELLVVLNSRSPIFAKVDDLEFLGVLAQADVVTAFLVEKRGWKSRDARRVRDLWLANHYGVSG
jgi:hypothetical protein